MRKRIIGLFTSLLIIAGLAGCGAEEKEKVTIGYFPNLTHIATIVALENGYFEEFFSEDVEIETKTFTNGGLFMEAMQTKEIDVGTVGPGPLINFYVKNPAYHLISGAVNGGAVLVGAKNGGVERLEDLDGKRVAIPVIGSTQDVMLRKALEEVDLQPTTQGGTVELYAQAPADTATLFVQESVEAAATQEPWGYILETQADGRLILDWDEFAWGKDSTNTVVAAREDFLTNEEQVDAYLKAHLKAVEFIQDEPNQAQAIVIDHIEKLTGKKIDEKEAEVAFSRLQVTSEVNEQVIQEMATISKKAEYIPSDDIDGLIDLSYLKRASE